MSIRITIVSRGARAATPRLHRWVRLGSVAAGLITLGVGLGAGTGLVDWAAPAPSTARAAVVASPTATSTPATGPDWTIVASPNQGSGGSTLEAVAAQAPGDAWAVGGYEVSSGAVRQTLIEHWNGTSWAIVPSPSPGSGDNLLTGVAANFADDAWAVGWYSNIGGVQQTLIEHWDGTAWTVVPSPNQGANANALSAVATNVLGTWAVGDYSLGYVQQTLVEHWDGTAWTVVPSANVGTRDNTLHGVVVDGFGVWAVGQYNNGTADQTLIEHGGGGPLAVMSSPNRGTLSNSLDGIARVASDNLFAVGDAVVGAYPDRRQTLIEHWNGTAWTVLNSPNPGADYNELRGVTAFRASGAPSDYDVWAVGRYRTSSGSMATLVERLNGFLWGVERSPDEGSGDNTLDAIVAASSTDVWAVGTFRFNSVGPARTLAERYTGYTHLPTPLPTACATTFQDVPPAHPFYAPIECLACRGLISGYGPNFGPDRAVTRGQAAKFIANAAGFSDQIPPGQQTFEDVQPGDPFWLYVEELADRTIIGGYACGTPPAGPCVSPGNRPYFAPNSSVTRGQMTKLVTQALQYADPIPAGQQTFEDVPPAAPFWIFVERAALHGLISGYGCSGAAGPCVPPANRPYFVPGGSVTRGQTAKIVANAYFPNCQP